MYTENNLIYEDKSKTVLLECNNKMIESFAPEKSVKCICSNAFYNCIFLKNVFLENENLLIETDAFPEPSIENLTIGGDLTAENDAFNVKGLKNILFLKSASRIDADIFYNAYAVKAPNLENIDIQEVNRFANSEKYKDFSVDGVWFQEDHGKIELIFYPSGKRLSSYEVPSFVDSIDNDAFYGNQFLEELIFPEKINDFDDRDEMVNNCNNLKQIVIKNKTVNQFFYPFYKYNEKLEKIYVNVDKVIKDDVSLIPLKQWELEKASNFKKLNNLYKDLER